MLSYLISRYLFYKHYLLLWDWAELSFQNECDKDENLKQSISLFFKKMEVCATPKFKGVIKHRSLSPFRILRGLTCLVILLSTAFLFLVFFVPVAGLLLRLFSIHLSRRSVNFLFGLWLALWPFLFEKINKTKVIFSGEMVPKGERVLLIANHRTEVDWMYLWDLALRKGSLGCIKYVLKSSLMKLPIFGWGFHVFEFIPVQRKWEVDEPVMRQKVSTFANPFDPLWLAVFPEGTDFTEEKCIRSQRFAAENGLPQMKNVLLPKTKGFYTCLDILRDTLDAVYDVTIAYKHNNCPSFLDNLFGVDPAEVHIHVRRIPIKDMPLSEDGSSDWLMNTFKYKDQLLSDFKSQGHFQNQGTEGELKTSKCLVNFMIVAAFTVVFVYLTFCSAIWFKVYIGLSCAYLTSATYFGFQAKPVLGCVKAMFSSEKGKKS